MATSKQRPKKHIKETEVKDKLTLKYWLIGALVVAAVVGLVLLVSYLAAPPYQAEPFTYENNQLIRQSDGRAYKKASAMYQVEAYTKNSEPYYGKAGDLKIYKVAYEDTQYDRILAMSEDNYLTDGHGTLYYSAEVSLPNLSMFDADEVSMGTVVTTDRGTTVTYLKTLTNNNAPDATDFVEEYLANKPYVDGGDPQETCRLKLTSSVKYPWLAIIMHLVRCDNEGTNDFYVYTDESSQSIKVSSDWFGDLWGGQNTTDTTVAPETTAVPTTPETPDTTN